MRALAGLAVSAFGHLLCALRGHEMVRRFAPGHISLQCLRCHAHTPGWTFDVDPRFRVGPRQVATSHHLRLVVRSIDATARPVRQRRSVHVDAA
jgi:hypothetical protein